MNDERYFGRIRGILTKKSEALDHAESMIAHIETAKRLGFAANKSKFVVYFNSKGLPTAKGDGKWHITMITNLFEIDQLMSDRQVREIARFEYDRSYFTNRRYKGTRFLSDADWHDLSIEYAAGLDAIVARAKVIADQLREASSLYEAPSPK